MCRQINYSLYKALCKLPVINIIRGNNLKNTTKQEKKMQFSQKINLIITGLGLALITGCTSLTPIDPMSNQELDTLIKDNVLKMIQQPRAKRLLSNANIIKIELLEMKNNTRSYMNREWDAIKNSLEEIFINYENVEFYNISDRRKGQKSINTINSEGLVKATQQNLVGEQQGTKYNIQVTINETQVNKRDKEYRMMIKWYERETQKPIAATSVYFKQ